MPAFISHSKGAQLASPNCAEDVSSALLFAQANNLEVSIRSGGHMMPLASPQDLLIDLSKHLNNVRIDAKNKLAYVQGGALWAKVNEETSKYGLAAVGATVDHVGVGGATTGGGFGWLSGEHGLAIDNLVSATVVVASGEILSASETENTDIFWAIRGGGSNFGIVTEFVFKLHHQADVFVSELSFAPSALPQLLEELDDWVKTQIPQEAAHLAFTNGPNGRVAHLTTVFNGPVGDGEARFERFYALGPIAHHSRSMPYAQLNTIQNGMGAQGKFRAHNGLSIPNFNKTALQRSWNAWEKFVTEVPAAERSVLVFEMYHPGKIESVAHDATAFALRNRSHNFLFVMNLSDAALTPRIHDLSAKFFAGVTDLPEVGYGNYCGLEARQGLSAAKLLFGANVHKLAAVKAKYDPNMVFNKWFAIPVNTPAGKATSIIKSCSRGVSVEESVYDLATVV